MRQAILFLSLTLLIGASQYRWVPECPADLTDERIPARLEDAIVHLACTLPPKVLDEMYNGDEDAMVRWHHGLGTGIRNSWGLWSGSLLQRDLFERGLRHPDDMSGVIFNSLWRKLHGKSLDVEGQVRHYQAFWAARENLPTMTCASGDAPAITSEKWSPDHLTLELSYAYCPDAGWYRAFGRLGDWTALGDDVPDSLREIETGWKRRQKDKGK
ncbi:MAG: DUF6794 domain-containing protein [Myxococcota bacterium]